MLSSERRTVTTINTADSGMADSGDHGVSLAHALVSEDLYR